MIKEKRARTLLKGRAAVLPYETATEFRKNLGRAQEDVEGGRFQGSNKNLDWGRGRGAGERARTR